MDQQDEIPLHIKFGESMAKSPFSKDIQEPNRRLHLMGDGYKVWQSVLLNHVA